MSHQEWLERVQEAAQRAKEAAVGHRLHPERHTPSPEDKARIASERVLNDNSPQPGAIVSTDKGLFVFRGNSAPPPEERGLRPVAEPITEF